MRHSTKIHRQEPNQQTNPRLFLVYGIIATCMLTLAIGLAYRQLIQKDEFDAAEQRQNYRRILMPGPRGNIYDRNGELLVGNRPLFSAVVYLNDLRTEFRREYIEQVRRQRDLGLTPDRFTLNTTARLAVVQRYVQQIESLIEIEIDVASNEIERHFSQSLLLPFPLARDISGEQYARLIENIPIDSPIQIRSSTTRFYPYGSSAAHTLGFVSETAEIPEGEVPGAELLTFRNEGSVGRSGLEQAFNEQLQGETGGEIWTVDPGGFTYERVVHEVPNRGKDLTITLDISAQMAVEQAMAGKTGAAVMLDIHSGEVIALVSTPSYDLNDLTPFISFRVDADIRERGAWLNRAIQGLYPPGSTFKLITALAALRLNAADDQTVVHCPGFHRVGRRIFHCHRRSGHGDENLVEAIRDSCNVFFYQKGIEIGVWPIAEEARRFRLHLPTGIELPAETRRMLVPDPEWKAARFFGESWFAGDTANLSIGQGFLLLTPMQMAVFAASVASGNLFVQPTLIPNNSAPQFAPIGLPQHDLDLILEGMRQAGQTGTARLASSPNIPVAGKTGTAQVRVQGAPSTLAWFVGFAPAHQPKYAVAVVVEAVPDSEIAVAGGATAAPIARTAFEAILPH